MFCTKHMNILFHNDNDKNDIDYVGDNGVPDN